MLPRSLTPNTSSLCLVLIQESHFGRPGCLETQQPTCLHVSPGGIASLHHHVLLFCFMTILSYPGLIPPHPQKRRRWGGRKENFCMPIRFMWNPHYSVAGFLCISPFSPHKDFITFSYANRCFCLFHMNCFCIM